MEARRKTYYDLLGVKRTATLDDIKKAYRDVARIFHPDSNFFKEIIDEGPRTQEDETFKKINEAYEILSDDSRRSAYDASLPPELADWEDKSLSDNFNHQLRYKKMYRFDDSAPTPTPETPRRQTFGQTSKVTAEDLMQLAAAETQVLPPTAPNAGASVESRPLPKVNRQTFKVTLIVIGGIALGALAIILPMLFLG